MTDYIKREDVQREVQRARDRASDYSRGGLDILADAIAALPSAPNTGQDLPSERSSLGNGLRDASQRGERSPAPVPSTPVSEEREECALDCEEWSNNSDVPIRPAATFQTAARLLRAPQQQEPRGAVVVTKNERGQIVGVTRQDEEGQILSVIATSAPQQQAEPLPEHKARKEQP